ncbi:MGMT family protein [Tessaracoccus sp. SD287]|uniref:MGMT family protein n=1 Tax=Tessaracoccus sp. SD287 TaxID=2782008 RepID=UPI001A979B22|nr:MGMT family protein [Tessaracoccus sp. SD287]
MTPSTTDQGLVAQVLLAVDQVPPGRVVSYGDVAALVGIGPRQVGRILARYGHQTNWWRVTNHAGELTVLDQARQQWAVEGITVAAHGRGCRITDHRADLARLASDFEAAGGVVRA